MPIRVTLDEMLAKRGMKARELAAQIGISETQLSLFRSGKVRGIRFRTMARLCAGANGAPPCTNCGAPSRYSSSGGSSVASNAGG